MPHRLLPPRCARAFPLAMGAVAALALGAPSPAAAVDPAGSGRITVSDGTGRTHSIWVDGTHKATEFFDGSLQYTAVGSWHAGGQRVVVTNPGDGQQAYVYADGNASPVATINGVGGEQIVGAALGPDGSEVATSSDPQGVKLHSNGITSTLYDNPSGRIAWSAEGTRGTLVWDGYPTGDSGSGIPGGPEDSDSSNAGIWASVHGGAPDEIVSDESAANPSISQDGRIIAYSASDATNSASDIYYLDMSEANPQPHRLPGSSLSGNDEIPAVSPDGTRIAFIDSTNVSAPKLVVADVAGGPSTLVENVSVNGILGLAWQPAVEADAGTVSVSGTPVVGQTLSIGGTAASGSQPLTVQLSWQRCDDQPTPQCTDIPGATASTYTLQAADTGSHVRARRRAFNAAGDETVSSATTATVTATVVDTTPPNQPSFTSGPNVSGTNTTPTFSWTGAEPGGHFECQLVGALAGGGPSPTPWATCTSPLTTPELATGPHELRVRQVDAAGNTGASRQYDWVVADPAPPVTPDTTPPLAPTWESVPSADDNHATPTFAWAGAEPGGHFECLVTVGPTPAIPGGWVTCASPFTTPSLPDGQYEMQVRQVDVAGNTGASRSHLWTIDTQAPAAVVLGQKPDATTTATSAAFSFQGSGGRLECRTGSPTLGGWAPCTSPFGVTDLATGPHAFEVRELDDAGNASEPTSWTWTVKPASQTPVPTPPDATPKPKPTPVPSAAAVPATPTATPPVPPVVKVVPKAPALTATVGGTKVSGGSATSAAATIQVAKASVGVGCTITGTVLRSCRVDLFAEVNGSTTHAGSAKVRSVLVGTGVRTSRAAAGASSMDVQIRLNATGKAMLRRNPQGLRIAVRITGRPVSGDALQVTGAAKLLARRAAATVGGFAVNSAALTPVAKRQLRVLARFGTAAELRCVGNTDASSDDKGYLRELGKRRAQAVCAFLGRAGIRPTSRAVVTRGATRPVVSNATAAGRAKNRRVQVTLTR